MKTQWTARLLSVMTLGALIGTGLPSPAHADPPGGYHDQDREDRDSQDWDRQDQDRSDRGRWDRNPRRDQNGTDRGRLVWSGDVDDTTLVTLRGDRVRTRTTGGRDAENVQADVRGRLPDGPVELTVRQREGRGRVRIVQQPSPDNHYTAVVRIYDPQPDQAHYSFEMVWRPARSRHRF